MRKLIVKLTGQVAAAGLISGFIVATMLAAGSAGAADLSTAGDGDGNRAIYVCGHRVDHIILFDDYGNPTVPARTPMYYCITGETLKPGAIPPPPEYCCR
jgi:hypothetical protein